MPALSAQFSDYAENAILAHWFGNTPITPPANWYFRFYPASTPPSDAGGGTQFSGASYAPITVANNLTNFPAASGRAKANGAEFSLPTATADYSAQVAYFGIWDASSGGNLWVWGKLEDASGVAQPKTIQNTNTFKIETGQFNLAIGGGWSNYWANKTLDLIFGAQTFSAPASIYFAQMAVANSENGGGTEFSTGSYARGVLANNTTNFPAPTGGIQTHAAAVTIPVATANQGSRAQWANYDALTGGNLLCNLTPDSPVAVNNGDNVTTPAGTFTWQLL